MRKFLPYIIACVLAAVSCGKHESVPGPGNSGDRHELRFSASTAWTKADIGLEDIKTSGWGLYGYYTGTNDYSNPADVQGVIFNGRRVRWNMGAWDYSLDAQHSKEYWPMSDEEKVTFFAYAPYDSFHSDASVDPASGPQVKYTASTDLSAQKDLLWATNTSGLPHRNVHLVNYPDSVVDMHFRHAPAKLHFTINGATLGDESGTPYTYGSPTTNTTYGALTRSDDATGGTVNANGRRTLYWAYRQKTVTSRQTYRKSISGFKILLSGVEMTHFIKDGILHLNNPDSYVPDWTADGDETITYTFGASDMNPEVVHPGTEPALSSGWGTTYLGVDADPKELLPAPDNYIYMIPKEADGGGSESKNIVITVFYHVIGLEKTIEFTRTTTTVSWQRVAYYTRNNSYYYYKTNNSYATGTNDIQWADFTDADHPSTSSSVDGTTSDTGSVTFNYSQDNSGLGFKAEGAIASNILGGRNYTINLYLDGRELNLTVIPQPWDLHETVYDYNTFLNPVEQSLTYDSDFVYDVIGSNVYINNRMGKFYFKLGSGMYLYWQASLIGDDAFAFTDENGQYLRGDNNELLTTIRGNIGDEMNYIYVKAINTASQVTSKAKLRIYLFNSENRAVVALPRSNWLFVSSSYINGDGQTVQVQEWNVVQTAN